MAFTQQTLRKKQLNMLISHKETGTIGDFGTSIPLLNALSKECGPLDLTFPRFYDGYIAGLKEFLEYQDFINSVDFLDRDGDFDLQCHPAHHSIPNQTYFVYEKIKECLNLDLTFDFSPQLKCPYIEIEKSIKDKNIVIDRTKFPFMKGCEIFSDESKFHFIDITKTFTYNINVCLQTNKKIYSIPTGLPIFLQYLNSPEMYMIYFENSGELAEKHAYFKPNPSLHYMSFDKFKLKLSELEIIID